MKQRKRDHQTFQRLSARMAIFLTFISIFAGISVAFCDITCDRFKNRLKPYKNGAYFEYNDTAQAAVTTSETHGYGMLVSVLQNDRATFDKLLNYFYLFQTPKGFMQWHQSWERAKLVKSGGDSSATDGDLDIAYALLLAQEKWSNNTYGALGYQLVRKLYDSCVNPDLKNILLGDWVHPYQQEKWIASRPVSYTMFYRALVWSEEGTPATVELNSLLDRVRTGTHERSKFFKADLMLDHFTKFSTVDKRWKDVLSSSIKYLQDLSDSSPKGLFPDFAQYDAVKKVMKPVNGFFLEKADDGTYNMNSCRVPWRLAAYYKTTKDAKIGAVLKKVLTQHFNNVDPVVAGYKLDGSPLVGYEHNCFTAPVWAAYEALNLNAAKQTALAKRIRTLTSNYYGDAVACLTQLQMA